MPHLISRRAHLLPASPIRKLAPLAEDARRRGVHVHHLNIGQPDLVTPPELLHRLAAVPEIVAYSPSEGTPEFLATMRAYYHGLGIALEEGQILATVGASEALLFAFTACADFGDDALVVEPFYTNYAAFATIAGVRLVPVTTHGDDGFHLPPRDAFEAALTTRSRMLVLCNPNNPTGTVYTHDELLRVAAFCKERGLYLVVDEVYREFAYDGRTAVSALSLGGYEDLVIVVDSLSKRYSACGFRLGCLVTRSRSVFDAGLRMAQGRLSPPSFAQLASIGIGEVGPEYIRRNVAEYQRRRDTLFRGLSEIPGVFMRRPEGAFYFITRLPVADSEDFARFLLADFALDGETVMVAPAPGFYATPGLGRDEVRIAYVRCEADLAASVRILGAALSTYAKQAG